MKSFLATTLDVHVGYVRGQGKAKAKAGQRRDKGKTRQDDETDSVCNRSSLDGKVAGSLVGMVTAECRVLDVCDIFIVSSVSSPVSPKKIFSFFGHFNF